MKIAVCYSGQIRCGPKAVVWHNNFLQETNADIFIHTWDVTANKEWHNESKNFIENTQLVSCKNSYQDLYEFQQGLNKKTILTEVENYDNWKNVTKITNLQASPLWYSWFKSIKMVEWYQNQTNIKYDWIIKLRPDIVFPSEYLLKDELIFCNPQKFHAMAYEPYRVDDVFFIASPEIMLRSSKFFEWLAKRNTPWYINIFGDYLKEIGIEATNMTKAVYAILRPESKDVEFPKFNDIFNIEKDYYAPKTFTFRR